MKTAELIEQRGPIVTRMNEAHGKDDNEAFAAAEAELRTLDQKVDRARKLDAADRADPGTPLTGSTDEHLSRELRSFSIVKMMAHKAGLGVDAGREIELQAELTKRAGKPAEGFYVPTEIFETRVQLTTNSGTITPTTFRPDLFTSALTATAVLTTLGATTLTGLTGDVTIPRETDSPQAGWVAENVALPYDDAAFDSLTLSPHHVGVITEISRQMLMQSSPAIEQLIRNMQARNIALEIDRAAIVGSGTGATPRGILNTTGVASVAYSTDLFTTTAAMIAAADLANVSTNRGFVSTNGIKGRANLLRDADGNPISVADTFHGEPVQFTNQAPNNLGAGTNEHALVYGDWADFLIGIWSQIDVLVNPFAQSAYEKGNVLVRSMATVDFGVRRPASFVKATGILGS
ncbi:MAG: phage major capsid protein [Sphingomonas sp.]|uniref:phage major capsid protein n=1 Tax=Sphingomonas sp. TaxID=28214 RepID=UPI00185CC354|nr:phage major capsid protein [Sphingomonas sp.]MBA3667940.1 phage major capsid protein [Sphingomonas sp.]